MFGKDKAIKQDKEMLIMKELVRIGQAMEEFKTEIGKGIWHLERRVETIQVKLNINPDGIYYKKARR